MTARAEKRLLGQVPPLELLHDFGGQGPVLHLAHANGFPPASYAPFADHLVGACHVIGLPARPLWPGSEPTSAPTWHTLSDDLVKGLRSLRWERESIGLLVGSPKGIGLGHSLGGVCTMLAALRAPDLFRALVLIDPVILPPHVLWALRLLRLLGLSQRQPLVRGALRRRCVWPSRQACFDHYRAKSFFDAWSDDSLWAYVRAATDLQPDGQAVLAYPPKWEAHIFATAPTDIWRAVRRLRNLGPLPLLVIRGQHSDTFRPASRRRMARLLPRAHFQAIPGAGHLVPLERPAETAAVVRDFLKDSL